MMVEEKAEAALDHLMFHRAIIDEGERSRKIERYMGILKDLDSSDRYSCSNPVDRSIEMVFDLVLEEQLDPWEIDLMEFSRLYARRMREEEIDFIVAGKLLFMAWSILKRQSEHILTTQEREDQGEPFFMDWDVENLDLLCEWEEEHHFPEMEEGPPLEQAVRRHTRRPVSLVELLDAFDEARREASRKLSRPKRAPKKEEFDEKSHKEELEKDMEEIWRRIVHCGGGALPMDDLCHDRREDMVKVFVSLLFLARMGRIDVWQEDLPHGQIFLEVNIPWDIGKLVDAGLEDVADEHVVM
ncbi:MAG: segregation/condensation protein A [Methanomassiliicoccales archaeon]